MSCLRSFACTFNRHSYFLRGIVLLESLWMALSFLARQRSLLRIRDLPLCLAAEIGIQHIPGFSNSLCRVRARLFTHANQRSVKGNDVSGFLIRDGSVLALRFRNDGYTRFIMFLHYPPTNILERRSGFTDMAEEYGAEQVIYAHCHGQSRFHDSIEGCFHGVEYRLVSGDYLVWKPAWLSE